MYRNAISISPGNNVGSVLSFDFTIGYLSREEQKEQNVHVAYEYENDSSLMPFSEINFIIENFHDVDFLNKKFNELREKEIDNKITTFEKILLYDILEKRILEFPNPHLPSDHEKGMEIIKRYNLIEEKETDEDNGNESKKKNWFKLFSWLG